MTKKLLTLTLVAMTAATQGTEFAPRSGAVRNPGNGQFEARKTMLQATQNDPYNQKWVLAAQDMQVEANVKAAQAKNVATERLSADTTIKGRALNALNTAQESFRSNQRVQDLQGAGQAVKAEAAKIVAQNPVAVRGGILATGLTALAGTVAFGMKKANDYFNPAPVVEAPVVEAPVVEAPVVEAPQTRLGKANAFLSSSWTKGKEYGLQGKKYVTEYAVNNPGKTVAGVAGLAALTYAGKKAINYFGTKAPVTPVEAPVVKPMVKFTIGDLIRQGKTVAQARRIIAQQNLKQTA